MVMGKDGKKGSSLRVITFLIDFIKLVFAGIAWFGTKRPWVQIPPLRPTK